MNALPLWLRRVFLVLAVLAVLFAAVAVWLVASFDPNRYKGTLIDWVREHQQRTLRIDGPITLSVFPRLALSLREVSLSEHRRPEEFAALKEATLSVALLPLLRQQLAVDRVSASGVRVVYTRDAKGVRNIDDLLTPRADAPKDPASSRGTLRFDIHGIALQDLQATVKDELAGIEGRFIVARLETGRLASDAQAGVKSPISLQARAELAQPRLDATIDLDAQLALSLPAGAAARIDLSDLKLALQGEGFGVALKDSTVAVKSLRFDPARRSLKLDALDVKLAGHSAAGPGKSDAKSADVPSFEATLAWAQLQVDGDTLQGSPLSGRASLAGPRAFTLDFSSQAPSGSFESLRVPGLKLTVSGNTAGRAVSGQIGTDLTIAPQPLAIALDALAVQLQFTDPAIAPVKLAVRGAAKASAKEAGAQLEGTVNEQKFDARLRADLGRARPHVDAQARFDALDLTRFVSPAQAGAKPAASPQAADAPVDLSALKAIDGRFGLRAGSLVYPPYRVADLVLDATLTGGKLDVSQLAGRAWNGRFVASAEAEAAATPANQRLAFKLDANGVDIAQLLGDVAQFKKLEGRGRVTADLATRGGSVQALKQQLDGRAAIALTDGAVRGINLAKTLRQWRSAVSLNQDATQASSAEEKTDFSEMSASFSLANGVATSRDLLAKSPFLRVGGEGAIDLAQSRIDYTARATVTGTPEGQGGADLEALKGVTVPVRLVGPFDAVDYKVQWSSVGAQVLTGAARGAFGDKAKAAVNDKLGGLLGTPAPAASGASAPAGTPKDQLKDAARQKAADELKKLFGR